MVTVAVSEARATLPALIERVEAGEEVVITRHGKPVAVLRQPVKHNAAAAEAIRRSHELRAWLDHKRPDPPAWLLSDDAPPYDYRDHIAEIYADRAEDVYDRLEREERERLAQGQQEG